MRVVSKALSTSLVLAFCLSVISAAQQAGQIKSMKLLTADVGWAATDKKLFWTTDNGVHWKDVTPKTKSEEHIASVFFLDSTSGWMLLVARSGTPDEPTFDLASTDTPGSSWTITHLSIPRLDPQSTTLTGDGRISFVDPLHGWLNLGVASSANFRLGILLTSNSGGKTWTWPPDGPGVFGRIYFNSLETGWLAGGPGDQKLYITHDASATWREVSLQAPPQAGGAVVPTYDEPPIFGRDGRGFLSVTFSGPEGTPSALVLYTSGDDGRTWKPDRVMLSPHGSSPGQVFPSTVADSAWIASSVSGQTPAITVVGAGAVEHNPKMDVSVPDSALLQLSFADTLHGWVLSNGRLLSTTDSGKTWSEIIPRQP